MKIKKKILFLFFLESDLKFYIQTVREILEYENEPYSRRAKFKISFILYVKNFIIYIIIIQQKLEI